jgi:signal transduction histidine kinase
MATATVNVGADEQLRLLAVTVDSTDPAAGNLLVVAESLEPFKRTLARARTLLLVGGTLAVLTVITGAMLLTSRALAPIGHLTRVAAGVALTGNYHERVPLPSHADEIRQLAETINDLIATVERTLEQQRQFLADTSHELRSPLTVLLANLTLLRRDLDPAERALSLEETMHEANRMRSLVNDLLLLAETDSTRTIARAPVHLDELVRDVVTALARRAATHTIQAHVEAPVVVLGDEERLRQLLRNLLDNATHHTPPGTIVDVRLRRSDGVVQLTVTDHGPGIPPEHLPHLWERFYQVDKARARAMGGSGLGLSIVKYIAEAHGGRVAVKSEPGHGTSFTILLPVPTDVPQPAEDQAIAG